MQSGMVLPERKTSSMRERNGGKVKLYMCLMVKHDKVLYIQNHYFPQICLQVKQSMKAFAKKSLVFTAPEEKGNS